MVVHISIDLPNFNTEIIILREKKKKNYHMLIAVKIIRSDRWTQHEVKEN